MTPLHLAALTGRKGLVLSLLRNGADVGARDGRGESPLVQASHGGRVDIVEILLGKGAAADLRGTGPLRYSALDRAAQQGHADIIGALVRGGAAVSARDRRGVTALHVACRHGHVKAVIALVGAGAAVNRTEKYGWSALMCGASCGSLPVMVELLERGARVNATCADGATPLHRACSVQAEGCREAAVDLLLRWGADESVLDKRARTPADVVRSPKGGARERSRHELHEVDRVGLLLSRATADRVWRRRCWLVMLQARATRQAEANRDGSGKAARGAPNAHGHVGAGGAGRRVRARRTGEDGALAKQQGLIGVVAWLTGPLQNERVFRAVVRFL